MFAYCNNNPSNLRDTHGTGAEALQWWSSTMWWLCCVDGALPFGDAIFTIGTLLLIGNAISSTLNSKAAVADSEPDEHNNALSEVRDYAKTITGPNEQYVVHHIVAQKAFQAEPSRNVLRSVGIDPTTNGLNLAVIPQSKHVSLHTASYYAYVNRRFYGLEGNNNAVVWTLAELQLEIQLYCWTGLKVW